MRLRLSCLVVAFVLNGISSTGYTQSGPSPAPTAVQKAQYPAQGKTISFLVPWPAGGANDIVARVQSPVLQRALGVPVLIVNRGGAAGQVGMTELVRAPADGYTLGLLTLPGLIQTYLEPERQAVYGRGHFQPVAIENWDSSILVVRADSPYKTMKQLIDAAKANPEKLKVFTQGVAGIAHMTLVLIEKETGVKFAAVHFEGGNAARMALLGGHVDAGVSSVGSMFGDIKSGQIRILGVADEGEHKLLPGVKTMEAQGYKIRYGASRGLVVRAGTPKPILDTLSAAAKKVMADEEVGQKWEQLGFVSRYMDEVQTAAFWDQVEAQTKPLIELTKQ